MSQGIIVAILSFVFYLTNLLGGGAGQPIQPINTPLQQQSYYVLGQSASITADRVTVRRSPSSEAEPLGTVHENMIVTILDKSENWYKIRIDLGPEGWVPDYAVAINQNQPKEQGTVILGFYDPGKLAYDSLLNHSSGLTSIAPLGWQLDSYGGIQASFKPEELGQALYFSGNQEIQTYAHLQVAANPSRLINAGYLQENTINSVLNSLNEWGLKGVLVDITYLPGEEQPELFQFLNTLASRLKQVGLKTMVSLPLDDSLDYQAASSGVDYIVLQHVPKGRQPGPLASLPELEAGLKKVLEQVSPTKVILALATSGQDWPKVGLPLTLSHQEVLELAANQGATIKWDAEAKSPYFKYGADREVWFENHYSLKYKLELVKKYGLGGIALRNLGHEDPNVWGALAKIL